MLSAGKIAVGKTNYDYHDPSGVKHNLSFEQHGPGVKSNHHLLLVSVRLHGHENSGLPDAGSSHLIPMTEQEDRLSSQAGTVRLDAFTHCLVAKCGPEVRC